MSFYKKNIDFLRKYSPPRVINNLIYEKDLERIKIEFLHDSKNIYIESGDIKCHIHSIYNIENEMELMFKGISKDIETLVIFGVGYGHPLLYSTKNFKKLNHLIIIEPYSKIFNNFLKKYDFSVCLNNVKSLSLIVGFSKEETNNILPTALLYDDTIIFNVVYNLNYKTILNDYYNGAEHTLKRVVDHWKYGMANTLSSVLNWNYNSISNLTKESIFFKNISDVFKGKTVVLVLAGPSLNKNAHLLNQVKEKAIVIAVGTAIRILDKMGIAPHFNIATDGKEEEYLVFKEIKNNKVPLIYANTLNHKILNEYEGPIIEFVLEGNSISNYVYDRAAIKYNITRNSYSCSIIAIDLLCYSKVARIILIGQDLSFKDDNRYAEGGNKDATIDKIKKRIKTTDIFGNEIYTESEYLTMKTDQEFIIAHNKEVEFLNCTEGGLHINGAKNKTLKNCLEQELKEDIFDYSMVQQIFDNLVHEKNAINIKTILNKVYDNFNEMIKFCEKSNLIMQEISQMKDKKEAFDKLLRILNELDSKMKTDFFIEVVANDLHFLIKVIESKYKLTNDNKDEGRIRNYINSYLNLLYDYSKKMDLNTKSLNLY